MDPLVCPLMSLTEPLKPLGDYPKCSHDKCAWWIANVHSCAVVALAAATCDESPISLLEQIAESIRGIKTAFDSYAYSNDAIVQAIEVFGKIGRFVETHELRVADVVKDLAVVLSEMRQRSELRQAGREQQQATAEKKDNDDTS